MVSFLYPMLKADTADYLVPTYRNMSGADKQAWALLNVAVGANDIVR